MLVGEMRDLETIEAALTIAETGHLVFAHAAHQQRRLRPSTASSTSSRRTSRRRSARSSRSCSQGVVSQQLLAAATARRAACSRSRCMIPNAAIRNLIREDKVHQIYSQMQVGQAKFGMQTLNQCLYALFQKRLISQEEAMGRSIEPDELKMMFEGRTAAQLSSTTPTEPLAPRTQERAASERSTSRS